MCLLVSVLTVELLEIKEVISRESLADSRSNELSIVEVDGGGSHGVFVEKGRCLSTCGKECN
jgi:hypothetical protein